MNDSSLTAAYEDQDVRFSAAFSAIRQAVENRAFPGASLAVTHAGELAALKSFGSFVYNGDLDRNPQVEPGTIFDLASLTKPIATTTMAMILYERGKLELNAPVAGAVPEILDTSGGDSRRGDITFRMLLAHSSGFPAYEKLYLKANSRDDLIRAAFTTALTANPGTRAEYSDIGFIILGTALERIAEEPLDHFCQREIFGPLAMTQTTFNPPVELRSQIPPTADETTPTGSSDKVPRSTFRNRIIQGEVQDENAFVFGGVAGHAGLFSRAEDLARFAHAMLRQGNPILRGETVSLFTGRESTPAGTSRALGWDTPSAPSQSGTHFGPKSFGHLGYTGTSLWIDPERELSITLLTNRTWPDCSDHAIKQVRPKVHDAIAESLR
ncbi:MAG TPA: serine hydrolase domain-containing protein [Candidatus Sulfotelmatobacter sp.]